jgi:hypothetical protein
MRIWSALLLSLVACPAAVPGRQALAARWLCGWHWHVPSLAPRRDANAPMVEWQECETRVCYHVSTDRRRGRPTHATAAAAAAPCPLHSQRPKAAQRTHRASSVTEKSLGSLTHMEHMVLK